jgi:putative restriction endonuclease
VTDAYERCCAITGEKIRFSKRPIIRPYADGGEHRVDNGLLLRSDAHILSTGAR